MIMGNYLGVVPLHTDMATKTPGGMWHPTVVPENFDGEDDEDENSELVQ